MENRKQYQKYPQNKHLFSTFLLVLLLLLRVFTRHIVIRKRTIKMGPKPAGKGKKAKGETEEEKAIREEEERKAAEREAKRLAKEAEERRLEELRIQKERKEFREAELARIEDEHSILSDKLSIRTSQLMAEIAHEADSKYWLKYRDAPEEPDASSERDVNTFITLVSDMSMVDMQESMEMVKKVEHAAHAVEEVWGDTLASEGRTKVESLSRSCAYMEKFAGLIFNQIDVACANFLRFTDAHLNDRAEVTVEESAGKVSMGMWGSFNDPRPIRKAIQFEKLGVQLDIPKQVLSQGALIHRVLRMPIESISFAAYEPAGSTNKADSIRNNTKLIVGDVLLLDLLLPPNQAFPLRAKKWVIRDKSARAFSVRKTPYPSTVATKVFFKIPDEVIMTDDVKIALWDETANDWTEEGLGDYQYADASRLAQFYITGVGMLALIRPRIGEFPYRSWSLQPIRDINGEIEVIEKSNSYDSRMKAKGVDDRNFFEKHARFTLETVNHQIVIDIMGTSCKLMGPDRAEFKDLIGVELTPGVLLMRLQRRGVNLIPTEHDIANVEGVTIKDPLLNTEVLLQISRCANALEFQSSSVWAEQGKVKHQIGFLVRESSAYTGMEDGFDFECVLAEMDQHSESYSHAPDIGVFPSSTNGVKFTLVMGNEYGDKIRFNNKPRPNEVSHLEISTAMASRATMEAQERMRRSNVRFQNTVYTLLRMINPLTLS